MKRMLGLVLGLAVTALVAQMAVAQDVCSPSKVTNLTATTYYGNIRLAWTGTGDDCTTGSITSWEVRYSSSAITDCNWQSASILASGDSSDNGCALLDKACPGTVTYYFAVFQIDDAGNRSPLSNVVQGSTRCTPPYTIGDCP